MLGDKGSPLVLTSNRGAKARARIFVKPGCCTPLGVVGAYRSACAFGKANMLLASFQSGVLRGGVQVDVMRCVGNRCC